jgi:hypothetical protein
MKIWRCRLLRLSSSPARARGHVVSLLFSAFVLWAAGCDSKAVRAFSGRPLAVLVVEARTALPIEGALVRVLSEEGVELFAGLSGPKGRLEAFVETSGRLRVIVTDPQSRYASRRVETAALEGLLKVELSRGFLARLAVRGAGGEPLEARISAWSHGGATADIETAANGEALLGPLPAGPVKMLVAAPGHELVLRTVYLPPRGEDLGEVRLQPGGATLRGRAAPHLESRPTEAVYRFDGVFTGVPVGAAGRFVFEGLPRGQGMLVLRRGERELSVQPVVIDQSLVDLGRVPGG